MYNQNSITLRLFVLTFMIAFGFCFIPAQDKTVLTREEPAIVVRPVGSGSGTLRAEEEDDSKVTGATVRGRLIYEDTNRPLRYAMITLVAEQETYNLYSSKFVKTDENGDFVFKNVKPGTYTVYVKSDGVLNQDSYKFSYRRRSKEDQPEDKTEKIEIAGLGEFQVTVAARRGGAISGRILYADGEAAVGVRVEALRRDGSFFSNSSPNYGGDSGVGRAVTDDRGAYRINGLPEGKYIVRVIEPAGHNAGSAQLFFNSRENQNSILRTYYPEGETSKTARQLDVVPGQEQSSIDITLPERRLFGISGKIVKKGSREPLGNFTVGFYKITERDELVSEPFYGTPATSNKAGEWSLKSLPAGRYRISIAQGYVYNANRDPNKKTEQFPNLSKEIEIRDDNLTGIDFEVPVEASVAGTIVVEGGRDMPENVRVVVYNEETKETYSDFNYGENKKAAPQKESAFRIGKLREGKYRLASIGTQNWYLKSATLGGRDVLSSSFEIKEGEALGGLQIVLGTSMGTVRGKVAGYDGKTQTIVAVFEKGAVPGGMQWKYFSTALKATGDFEIKAAPGEYSVIVMTAKNRPKTPEETKKWFEDLTKNGQQITVRENETVNVSLAVPQ